MSKPNTLDYSLLVAIGLFWGSQFALNEVSIESLPPLTVAAGRVLVGFITLSVIVLLLPRRMVTVPPSVGRQPWGLYCGIALAEAIVPCFLIPWGQQHVDSSIAAILIATVPIITLILAPIFVKEESWSRGAVLSVLIGFIGVVVLLAPNIKGSWFTDIIGELAILTAAFGWSMSMIMMKRLPEVPPVLAMRNIFMIASLPLVISALFVDMPWTVNASAVSLVALLALGVFCGGFAYALFIYSVGRTGPTFTSLVGYLIALFGVFIGITLMGDKMQTYDLVALTLIVVALGIANFKAR